MNKKGMTLIELLVYMAIAALLLAPVIMLVQNSSLNMARNAVNTDLRISGRDILNIMYEDIRNTGFKLKNANGTVDTNVTYMTKSSAIWIGDTSSFRSGDGGLADPAGRYDTLTIRKGRLNNNGEWLGYDTVRYHVSGDTLIRTSAEFNNAATPVLVGQPKRQVIATNLEALQFQYSPHLDSIWREVTNAELAKKRSVKYIKVFVVTKDTKKLSPTRTSPTINVGNHSYDPPDDQVLREQNEIVVPIPNNGMFPP